MISFNRTVLDTIKIKNNAKKYCLLYYTQCRILFPFVDNYYLLQLYSIINGIKQEYLMLRNLPWKIR